DQLVRGDRGGVGEPAADGPAAQLAAVAGHVGDGAIEDGARAVLDGAVVGAELLAGGSGATVAIGHGDAHAGRIVDHVERVRVRLGKLAGVDLRLQLRLDLRVGDRGRGDGRRDGDGRLRGATAEV